MAAERRKRTEQIGGGETPTGATAAHAALNTGSDAYTDGGAALSSKYLARLSPFDASYLSLFIGRHSVATKTKTRYRRNGRLYAATTYKRDDEAYRAVEALVA